MTKRLAISALFGFACWMGMGIECALAADINYTTYTVSNGLQCREASGRHYAYLSRDQGGIRNKQSSTQEVWCPFNTPSYDTERGINPRLLEAWVYVNGSGPAPACLVYTMSQAGVFQASDQGVLIDDYYEKQITYRGRVIRFDFRPQGFQSVGEAPDEIVHRTASIGYYCAVPPNGQIHGASASFYISPIAGGVR
jgi:hypothetical protein